MRRMMSGERTRRIAILGAASCVCVLTLTGCGPADAGTAAADDIVQEFSDVDGVASVEASGSNDLPFVGSVEATVTTDPGLSDDLVDELAEDLAGYMSAGSGISWSVALTADAITVGLTSDDAQRELRLSTARELARMPHVESARVAIDYEDPVVLVEVDAPEALSVAYAAAEEAVDRLGIDDYDTNAGVVSGADGAFTVDDESRGGDDTAIQAPLRIFDAVLARFPLVSAAVTPEKLELRVASEGDVASLEAFVAAIRVPGDLEIEVQGGNTTIDPDATASADAVASVLQDVDEVAEVRASENFVSVVVSSRADASAVLDAAAASADFLALDGFSIRDPDLSFRVFDRPADFAASLRLATAASALPTVESVEVARYTERPRPSINLRFESASEETMSAFATTMKAELIAGGWGVWLEADGFIESFAAEDRITLEDSVSDDRDRAEQEFADALVRLWNGAAT